MNKQDKTETTPTTAAAICGIIADGLSGTGDLRKEDRVIALSVVAEMRKGFDDDEWGKIVDEIMAPVIEARADADAKKEDARLVEAAKLGQYKTLDNKTFRWGVVTAYESDLMDEALIAYGDAAAVLQQQIEERAKMLDDSADMNRDFVSQSVYRRLGRLTINYRRKRAAITIRGVEGGGLNKDVWPEIKLHDAEAAIETRVNILLQLDRTDERELRLIAAAHLDVANGLTDDEAKN